MTLLETAAVCDAFLEKPRGKAEAKMDGDFIELLQALIAKLDKYAKDESLEQEWRQGYADASKSLRAKLDGLWMQVSA